MSTSDSQPTPTTPITLLTFPSGMPVTVFSAMTDLLSTALGADADVVLRAPGSWQENSTVAVNNLTTQQVTRRLRAAAGHIDGSPRPELEVEPDGSPVLALGSGISFADGGVDLSLGFDDATREQGMAMLGAIAKCMTEELSANPEAINYLQWSWTDRQSPHDTYRLIGVKPGRPTPHDLRMAAECECDRLRELLISHGFDPGSPAPPKLLS